MDKSIEEKFVNNFVIKDKRERILFELGSQKKRVKAMQRLFNLLDKRYAVSENLDIGVDGITAAVKKYCKTNSECYVISETADDGKFLPFETALKNMLNFEVNYFMICDNNTVIASEEYNTYGPPNKLILHR